MKNQTRLALLALAAAKEAAHPAPSGSKTYIQSVPPVNTRMFSGIKSNKEIEELNEEIKKIADEGNLPYIDIHSALLDKDGQLNPEYSFDGLHLNGSGYLIWVNAIRGFAEKIENK